MMRARLLGLMVSVFGLWPWLGHAEITGPVEGTPCNADNAACEAANPSHQADDLLQLICRFKSTGGSISTPSGWTLPANASATSGNRKLYVFNRIATSGAEANPSCTPTGGAAGDLVQGVVVRWRGTVANATTVVDDSTGANSTTADLTIAHNGCVSNQANNAVVIYWAHGGTQTGQTALSGMSTSTPYNAAATGTGTIGYQHKIETTAVGCPSGDITVSGGSGAGSSAVAQSLKAAAAAAPTFTAGPTAGTSTTTTIPTSATVDKDTTLKGVLYADGGSTPSCSQIQSGQDATGSAAYATCSVACTAATQCTCTFSGLSGTGSGNVRDSAYCGRHATDGDTAVSAVADRYKLPAWLTTPTVSDCTSSACTVTGELDGAGTTKLVGCPKDAAAPDADESAALTCAGGATALSAASDDATINATLASITPPVLDIYVTGYYVTANKIAPTALVDNCLDPATGKVVINCPTGFTSIDPLSPIVEFSDVATPDIVAGDIGVCDSATNKGHDLVWTATGLYSYPPGDPSQQRFSCVFYDVSAFAMHADTMAVAVNNNDPIADVVTLIVDLIKDQAMGPVNLGGRCTDPDDDPITVTTSDTGTGTGTDTRPSNTAISAGSWTGTPDASGSGAFTTTCADDVGGSTTFEVEWTVTAPSTVPQCVGEPIGSCLTLLEAQNLNGAFASQCSSTVPALTVIGQDPAATSVVDPFSTVALTVSSGQCSRPFPRLWLNTRLGL